MFLFSLFLLPFSNPGVIVVDNVWFYEGDLKSTMINTGDMVEIIERGDTFLKVSYNNAMGRIHKGVLIDLSEEIAEERLFVFVRGYYDESEYTKSAALFNVFIDYFDTSYYLAEVLYYSALSYEEIAKTFTEVDTSENIFLNEKNNKWYYSGNEYEMIIERFPESKYASKAAYSLIHIFRTKNLPWYDSLALIQEELQLWHEFIT